MTTLKPNYSTIKETDPRNKIKRRLSVRSISVAFGIVGGLIAYLCYAFWPVNPDTVAEEARTALEKGDVNALLALTNSEERDRLNLNSVNVNDYLKETIWRNGPIKLKLVPREDPPKDNEPEKELTYEITSDDVNSSDMFMPNFISVFRYRRPFGSDRYYLALSYNLYHFTSCVPNNVGTRRSVSEMVKLCRQLLHKHKILGVRSASKGYTIWDKK